MLARCRDGWMGRGGTWGGRMSGRGHAEGPVSPRPAATHLQERAPPELCARDPPGPGPVDRVEDPLYDL